MVANGEVQNTTGLDYVDTMTTSKRQRDVIVTLVGLSINWWAFTEAQKDRRASPLGFLNSRSQALY